MTQGGAKRAPPTQSSNGSEGGGRRGRGFPFYEHPASCRNCSLILCAGQREEEPPLLPVCRETGSQELSCGDTKYSCILATASRVVVTGKNSQQSHQGWPGGEPCLAGEQCRSWLWKGKDKPPHTPVFPFSLLFLFSYLVTLFTSCKVSIGFWSC